MQTADPTGKYHPALQEEEITSTESTNIKGCCVVVWSSSLLLLLLSSHIIEDVNSK
jgi:hypothetical protein